MNKTRSRRFIQCDVFTSEPTRGNALAVIVDALGLTDAQMQRIAAWTNLAETTFLLPPEHQDADYKVRILTPEREMPFAGHPTLGSCAAWLHCGGKPKEAGIVRQECGVGIVEIDIARETPAFIAPPTTIDALSDSQIQYITEALNIQSSSIVRSALLNNGPQWQVLELETAEQVLAVDSSRVRWPEASPIGLIGKQQSGHECDYEVRMLAPSSGMSEDPITGSLNAAIARWMRAEGRLERELLIAQGSCIDRLGRVAVIPSDARADEVRIGGETHILIDGHIDL